MPDSNVPPNPYEKPTPKRSPWKSAPLFWALFFVVTTLAIFASVMGSKGHELSFGRFKAGLESGDLNKDNVFELTFADGYIRFQDQPALDSSALETPDSASDTKQYFISIANLPDDSVASLEELLHERGIVVNGSNPSMEWTIVFNVVTILLVVFLFVVFMKRIGGPGSAMAFGRSRGRLMSDDQIKTTFADVAGIDEPVQELQEIVSFLKTPEKYRRLGGRIPRGVLLVGPPGTGKTLLAKAVAGEAGVPFFSLSGSDFVELYVGIGAARVRDMFTQAVLRSPSIIFIDELDALGKVRGGGAPGSHDEREQTLNAMLVEMDGFSSDQSVIVIGATNRPETLDPALLRPGRFDRHVLVDRPDYKGREAILKVHAARIKMDDTVNLPRIAKLTPGFVGADLANLVNEAALLAARRDKAAVSMREFEEGIERVIAGLEKSTRIIHEDEKQRVAYHECGHALVAGTLPHTDPVHKISIIPRGYGALGYTLQRPEDDRYLITQRELENRICVLLGGIAAEDLIFEETSTGAQNDLERATDIARRMVTQFGMSPRLGRVNFEDGSRSPFVGVPMSISERSHSEQTMREIDLEVQRIIAECMATARDVLRERREVLEHLTRDLIEREVMDQEQFETILRSHQTGPQIKPGTFVSKPATPVEPQSPPDAAPAQLAE
jgi:cell division protease FtsH